MTSWIFQANPKTFDIDGFLSTRPDTMLWSVKQSADAMKPGDQVFIWRAIGGGDEKLSGILAEAVIEAAPAVQPEEVASLPFWANPSEATPQLRVSLRLLRIELRLLERFKRSWFDYDPVMSKSAIIKQPAGTNFRLSDAETIRLNALWRRAMVDWDYGEAVAGLWAFWKTKGQQVSRLPGAPVIVAAMQTGRVVGGMYNKVMNFRAMDPTDQRKGLSATSNQDKAVWAKFWDSAAGTMRGADLEEEFARLWPDDGLPFIPAAPVPPPPPDLKKLTLEELLARYDKAQAKGQGKKKGAPRTYRSTTTVFERDELVVTIALVRAHGACEVPGCTHGLFKGASGDPFLEVHHIEPLRDGGLDRPENVAGICPSHHREAHHGLAAASIRSALTALRTA
jgi:hypothetical protein